MEKVLIIDDDVDMVKSMESILTSKGYEVLSACDGASGVEVAKKEKPDLIILDVMMAHSTEGFDTSRTIKKDENLKDVPILMLTAIKQETGMDFKKEAGDEVWLPVDDYCDKPLRPEVLLEKVDKLLGKRG